VATEQENAATLAALNTEIEQFKALCPEHLEWDTAKSGDAIIAYLAEHNTPMTAGSMLAAFMVLRRMGKLTKSAPVETAEQKATREYEEKKTVVLEKRIKEQEANRPLQHVNHKNQDDARAADEAANAANAKKMWERLEEMRKKVVGATPPLVYWPEGTPMSGRIDWRKTEEARLAAGFNRDGSVKEK